MLRRAPTTLSLTQDDIALYDIHRRARLTSRATQRSHSNNNPQLERAHSKPNPKAHRTRLDTFSTPTPSTNDDVNDDDHAETEIDDDNDDDDDRTTQDEERSLMNMRRRQRQEPAESGAALFNEDSDPALDDDLEHAEIVERYEARRNELVNGTSRTRHGQRRRQEVEVERMRNTRRERVMGRVEAGRDAGGGSRRGGGR